MESPNLNNTPVDTGRKLNVHKTSEDVLDVFGTSYVRSIYVLCLLGHNDRDNKGLKVLAQKEDEREEKR